MFGLLPPLTSQIILLFMSWWLATIAARLVLAVLIFEPKKSIYTPVVSFVTYRQVFLAQPLLFTTFGEAKMDSVFYLFRESFSLVFSQLFRHSFRGGVVKIHRWVNLIV